MFLLKPNINILFRNQLSSADFLHSFEVKNAKRSTTGDPINLISVRIENGS